MFTCILLPLGYTLMNSHQCSLRSLEILSRNFYKEERLADYSRRTSNNVTTRLNKPTIIITHVTKTKSYKTCHARLLLEIKRFTRSDGSVKKF